MRVDPHSPAFANPTKFVGPVYTRDQADKIASAHAGWVVKPDGRGGFRRVVPSPPPIEIMQMCAIQALLAAAGPPPMRFVPIACGGGGVPVIPSSYDGNCDGDRVPHGSWADLKGIVFVYLMLNPLDAFLKGIIFVYFVHSPLDAFLLYRDV